MSTGAFRVKMLHATSTDTLYLTVFGSASTPSFFQELRSTVAFLKCNDYRRIILDLSHTDTQVEDVKDALSDMLSTCRGGRRAR